jgi:glycosyltransferase involved in cell wall biosynthesis
MVPAMRRGAVITFVVPAHNEEALLGRTLASIHSSARPLGEPHEVVVVNDASTDRTGEIARGHGARVIDVAHRQIAATRNAGARAAAGDRLVFVDADTVVTPRLVRAVGRALSRGAVGGGSLIRIDGPLPAYARAIDLALRVFAPMLGLAGGCFLFCTRAAYRAAGGFDEALYATEEVAFARRLKALGRFVILRETVTTSGRKLRARSALAMLGIGLRLARAGPQSVRRREGLEYWYGPRQPDRPEAPPPVGTAIPHGPDCRSPLGGV